MAEEPPPVVVGVDGSDPSNVALRWAADEAVRCAAPLRLLHAAGPWACDIPFSPAPEMVESLRPAGRSSIRRPSRSARAIPACG
jgi:nucleotide-binding universal stress UspA family protein